MKEDNNIQRTFIPGDKWLYYKIYTGPMTADLALKEVLYPVFKRSIEQKIIDKYFFIRYSDPESHIRARFHCFDIASICKVIEYLHSAIKYLANDNLIWKTQIDTYEREIERYGSEYIELAEYVFYYDSEMILTMLKLIEEKGENFRWHFALKSVDVMLDDFGFNIDDKLSIYKHLSDGYRREFGMNSLVKRQIDKKYREETKTIDDILAGDDSYLVSGAIEAITKRSDMIRKLVPDFVKIAEKSEDERSLVNLIASLIHMSMNRIFVSKQRKHELVIYDFLFRYYKSFIAREKYNK